MEFDRMGTNTGQVEHCGWMSAELQRGTGVQNSSLYGIHSPKSVFSGSIVDPHGCCCTGCRRYHAEYEAVT